MAQLNNLIVTGSSRFLNKINGACTDGTTVSSQTQSTKFLRQDGTWAAPSYTSSTIVNHSSVAGGIGVKVSTSAVVGSTTYTVSHDTSPITAGTYQSITVDATGHVTAGSALTKAQVTTALGYTPPTSDTNTHRPIQMNGTEILGNNTTALNLKAGSNVTLTNSSGTVTIAATDTNTWRGIQNNLTSDSTTDSLSAYQGKLLANGSARDSTKLPLSGGTLTGKLTLSTDGLEVPSAAGYTIDQYGNLVHKRATDTDAWKVTNSAGTGKLTVHYETGNVTAAGSVTATQFNGPATKLTTTTAGGSDTPVYFTGGVPTACGFKVIHGSLASNTSKIYNMIDGLVLMWRGARSTSQCEMVLIQQWDDGSSVNGRVVLRTLTGAGCSVYTSGTSIQLSNTGSNYLQILLIGSFSS